MHRPDDLRWSVSPLPWDSEFLGERVAMLQLDPAGDPAALDGLAESCDTAYLLCAANRVDAINAAERCGFRLVDLRCVVELRNPVPCRPGAEVTIRSATEQETRAVSELAAQLHDNTRFANDVAIPRSKVAELYRRYVVRDAASAGWGVLVAVRGDELLGYATHGPQDRDGGGLIGTIGLVGVAPSARGTGVGSALVAAVVEREADASRTRMTVITQGGSRAALTMYERAGFAVTRIDVWLHWHRQDEASRR